jgi:hypothetical protein
MAIRKATIKQQVITTLSQQAPPGEQFIATIECMTGPSPWLIVLLERIPFVALIVVLMRRYYFVTATNSSIVVNKVSRFSNRPQEILVALPIQQTRISRVKLARTWSSIYFLMPGKQKPTRLNVSRYWRNELEQVLGVAQSVGAIVG